MRLAIVGLVAMVPSAAAADPANEIGDQAERCWNLSSTILKAVAEPMADFDVLFDRVGAVKDITVVDYEPKNEIGEQIVRSASHAIERCSPYVGTSEGVNRVRMHFREVPPIDPFKAAP